MVTEIMKRLNVLGHQCERRLFGHNDSIQYDQARVGVTAQILNNTSILKLTTMQILHLTHERAPILSYFYIDICNFNSFTLDFSNYYKHEILISLNKITP
jgi:hypothetical protein